MSRILPVLSTLLAVSAAAIPTADAQIKMSGNFVAGRDCPALVSIRKKSNPGGASVKAGETYQLIGKNKDSATHFLLEVPGAKPSQRWVEISCGNSAAGEEVKETTAPRQPTEGAFHILAVSWQPAFCEGLPGKPECKSQTNANYDAKNFTLHGLWPQPRSNVFCGVAKKDEAASEDRRWRELPEVKLSLELRKKLERVMPGTQSGLERHEWIKHGTCYVPGDMETYYKDSVRLVEELNASAGSTFMAANIGKTMKARDLRAKFDESLGIGAGDRMRFACKRDGNREILVEITVGLKGDAAKGTSLKDLITAASPTDPGCPEFVVDPVGLQ